jgi:Leucine-rich repeat (LRR) protein
MPSLRILSAINNKLTELPSSICIARLYELNIQNNLIKKLPNDIGKVPLLKLGLLRNPIVDLPKSFCEFKNTDFSIDWQEYIKEKDDIVYLCA